MYKCKEINAYLFQHICIKDQGQSFSRIMNFKGLAIFALCFVGIQGCFNESLMKRFTAIDLDQDGFLTKAEVCQAMEDDPECDSLWNDFDTNEDGKASCQGT